MGDLVISLDTAPYANPGVPRELIAYTCGYDDFGAFLRSGIEVKTLLELALLKSFATRFADYANVLDFGCGCGRLLRFIKTTNVFGCDVNGGCAAYCKAHMGHANVYRNADDPPLIYRDGLFDLIYSFSVFSHLRLDAEEAWLAELVRVGAPGCVYLITVHGDWMIEHLGADAEAARQAGFSYQSVHQRHGSELDFPEYYEASFHTSSYIKSNWSKYFEILSIMKGDSSGHYLPEGQKFEPLGCIPILQPMGQDLVIARKRAEISS